MEGEAEVPKMLGLASEDEVVLEFVRAETQSTRFKDRFAKAVDNGSLRKLVECADLSSEPDNRLRRRMLDYRGYEARTALFTGFPRDVQWFHAELSADEMAHLRYGRDEGWLRLTKGTRLVVDGVRNLQNLAGAEMVESIARRYANRETLPRPIVVEHLQQVVIIEGHARATAFLLAGVDHPLRVLLGRSPGMSTWMHF